MGKLAPRNAFQRQLYNFRRMLRGQAEKLGRIRDEDAITAVELVIRLEQHLFRLEIGTYQRPELEIDDLHESDNGEDKVADSK